MPRQPHAAEPAESPGDEPPTAADRPSDLGEADALKPVTPAAGEPAPAADAKAAVPADAPPAVTRLAEALSALRAAIGGTAYPLVMPSAEEAQRIGTALVTQLDDYLLPRLARLDAPLLVVVGGSTGAGKSTLVNSLVRAPVSTAGVLRPTTRSPVLVSNPADLPWFQQGQLLPGLTRTREPSNDAGALQLVSAPALGAGLAFLDAPDIDSVVDRNRKLAAQLLAAADLWLFVTTAARYADAVPWELLTTARLRGTVIALVLDRVPGEAAAEIATHLQDMLSVRDLGAAPLFVLPETRLDGQGLISEEVIGPLHDWFGQLAADSTARAAVVRQTLDGALMSLTPAVAGLADAADEQARAAAALGDRVTAAYRTGRQTMADGLRDGRLLRGEVLARWQEFVGTGEFLKTLENKVGQMRDRFVAALTGRPAPGRNLQVALESQLVTLLRGIAADAAEQAYTAWQAHPAGAALLDPGLQRPATDLPERANRLVRDWQQWVLGLVRAEGAEKRVVARGAAYAVNGAGLAVMIAVFTSTAFIPTGLEVAAGAGSAVAAQKVLEAIFGDQAIRTLATQAREELLLRAGKLLDEEAARFTDRLASAGIDAEPGARLRQAAADVETARTELALTGSA
ncbi:ABC transporter [Paractinoplanes ovalisporus]|uniref:GTPase domain-containing protein n=1 Tax=Paractinoplanes ovalisporus TaxID=2810368 RepID=UPI003F691D00